VNNAIAVGAHGALALRQALFQDQQIYGVIVTDADGIITDWNPTSARMYGYEKAESVGRPVAVLHRPPGAEILSDRIIAGVKRDGYWSGEIDFVRKDGSEGVSETVVFVFEEETGRLATIGFNRDITERKHAEEELQRTTGAAELLNAVATAANDATTADSAISVCLDAICAYSGWPVGHAYLMCADGCGGLVPSGLWHLDDPDRYEAFRRVTEETAFQTGVGLPGRVAADGGPHWLPFALADKDLPRAMPAHAVGIETGFAFPVMVGREVAAVLEFFSGESVERDEHLLSIAREAGILIGRVIERQRLETDRATSQRRLAGIVDIAPEAVISIDTRGRIQLFNQGAEAIFGYNADEVMGQPIDLLIPERFRANHGAMIEQFLGAPDTSRLMTKRATISARRKDGTQFPAEASISKLELPEETVLTVLLRDITERQRAEEALLAAKEEAELASRTKTEFLANMSHELRTPLNAIIGFAELLSTDTDETPDRDQQRQFASVILDSGQLLLSLINDVLDISKIEAGAASLYETTLDVAGLIEACVTMVRPRAQESGVTLKVDIAPGPLPALLADETRIKQVLINLLSNAVKFTEAGGAVTVKAWHNVDTGLVLQIADTGIGMAPEDIPKALARFQQVDSDLNRKHDGSGLGLPLAKSLVELHGGSLDLQSQPGVGTTATVRLPASRAA
jgi:PAS domain S-box-containing protein